MPWEEGGIIQKSWWQTAPLDCKKAWWQIHWQKGDNMREPGAMNASEPHEPRGAKAWHFARTTLLGSSMFKRSTLVPTNAHELCKCSNGLAFSCLFPCLACNLIAILVSVLPLNKVQKPDYCKSTGERKQCQSSLCRQLRVSSSPSLLKDVSCQ